MSDDPITVHLPADPLAPIKRSRPYLARCGIAARLPARVKVCQDDDARMMGGGTYFVAGPHPRYYRTCPECAEHSDHWDGGIG